MEKLEGLNISDFEREAVCLELQRGQVVLRKEGYRNYYKGT